MNSRPSVFIRSMTLLCVLITALGILIVFLAVLPPTSAAMGKLDFKTETPNGIVDERWRIFADIQQTRADPGVAALNNKIYVMGGFSPSFNSYIQAHEVYDPQTDSWQYLADLPISRSDLMVAPYADKLYAIGGWNAALGGALGYTHMYDPGANNWITKESMITPVSGARAVVLTDTILVLGGYYTDILQTVQIYSPTQDSWSLGTSMPVGRSEFGAVLLDGKIYAIGGVTSSGVTTNTVAIYDPVVHNWTDGPPMPEARSSMAVSVRQGKIYVVGGTNDWASGTFVNTAFVFDPAQGTWTSVNPLPTGRTATRAAVISDTIYVIGGVGDPGAPSANEGFGFPPVPSTITVSSDDPDPSQFNQPFTVNFAVTATGEIPTGVVTVTVNNRTESCIGSLTNGQGNCQLAISALGTFTNTATYSGDNILLRSSDTGAHTVVKANTDTMINSSEPEPSLFGTPITVSFTVTSPFGIPTGAVTVTVSDQSTPCSGILANGSGNCSLTLLTPGIFTLTADYSGDATFNPSSGTKTHIVVLNQLFLPIVQKE